MKGSQLHCFGNGSSDILPANLTVGIAAVVVAMVFKDLRGSSSSSHEQRTEQSRTYELRSKRI